MEQIKFYTIDLTKIKGSGEIKCPRCGVEISPDDETEAVYTILETLTERDCLEKIILQCNKCGSRIHLTGFHVLNQVR